MVQSAFGKIVIASQVEYAVRDILQLYFPTYLRELERQMEWEREALPTPRNYTVRNSLDVQSGEEIPKVVVVSPGLWEPPEVIEGEGYYVAKWQVGVGVAIAAPTEEEADAQAKMYGAAARAILLQHQSLERDDVSGVFWLDENYDDLELDDQLANYKAAQVFVAVQMNEAVNRWMKPPRIGEDEQEIQDVERVVIQIPSWDKEVERPIP